MYDEATSPLLHDAATRGAVTAVRAAGSYEVCACCCCASHMVRARGA
ncbi:MAG TPA: hypothetical protein VGG06_08165 [Thermoanaerobaculia bacterium]